MERPQGSGENAREVPRWRRCSVSSRGELLLPASSAARDADETRFPYWRRNLRVAALSNLLSSGGFALAWPFLPLMVRGLGVQENLATWVGHMMLGFYFVSLVMNPIWGGIADHYGRKIMILRASLGMGLCMTLVPFAPTPLAFACLIMSWGSSTVPPPR